MIPRLVRTQKKITMRFAASFILTSHRTERIVLWSAPLPNFTPEVTSLKRSHVLCLFLVMATTVLLAQSNPIALVYQPLTPAAAKPGQPAFILTVHGTNFVQGAAVKWNGRSLTTKFVSKAVLQAVVPAQAVAHPSTASVTVSNPGVIASNVVYLPVRNPSSTVTLTQSTQTIEGGQVAIGDFNNDGRPDIAVESSNEFLDIYLNAMHGNLVKVSGPQWGGSFVLPAPLALAADFNGDGNLDVSICLSTGGPPSGCGVYLGDGRGGLTAVPGIVQGSGSVADINGGGILDFVTVVESSDGIGSTLIVSLGAGDGTFPSNLRYALNNNKLGGAPVVGDFNRDGKLDVAVPVSAGYVAVFLGNGDGTLRHEIDYPVANPGSLAVADLNGDGILDLVTNGVSVLLGRGDGTFTAGSSLLLPNANGTILVGDLNGDGKLDLVTATMDSNFNQTVNIFLGNGDGTFQNPISFAEGEVFFTPSLGIADMNHDGRLDIVVGGQSSVNVLLQVPSAE